MDGLVAEEATITPGDYPPETLALVDAARRMRLARQGRRPS